MGRKDRKANERMNQQTNATNLQMNRETNEANMALNQANIDYAREAWDKEVAYNWEVAEYNNASNQRKRLEEAGLNPYMMLDGGDAGTASSSAPSHNQPQQLPMQAGHVDPYYVPLSNSAQDVQNLLGAIGQAADVQLKRQQEIGMGLQNQYYAQRQATEIAEILSRSHNNSAQAAGQQLQNAVVGMSMNSLVKANQRQPDLMNAQIGKLESDVAFNQANTSLTQAKEKNISYENWIKAVDVLSQVDLRKKQGALIGHQAALLDAQTAREKINSEIDSIERDNKIRYTPQQRELLTTYIMRSKGIEVDNAWTQFRMAERQMGLIDEQDANQSPLFRPVERWFQIFRGK